MLSSSQKVKENPLKTRVDLGAIFHALKIENRNRLQIWRCFTLIAFSLPTRHEDVSQKQFTFARQGSEK